MLVIEYIRCVSRITDYLLHDYILKCDKDGRYWYAPKDDRGLYIYKNWPTTLSMVNSAIAAIECTIKRSGEMYRVEITKINGEIIYEAI